MGPIESNHNLLAFVFYVCVKEINLLCFFWLLRGEFIWKHFAESRPQGTKHADPSTKKQTRDLMIDFGSEIDLAIIPVSLQGPKRNCHDLLITAFLLVVETTRNIRTLVSWLLRFCHGPHYHCCHLLERVIGARTVLLLEKRLGRWQRQYGG